MDIGVSSLVLAPASPRRSEGEAKQHAHARPRFTPQKCVCRLRPGRHAFELSAADARIMAADRGKGSRSIGELAER
eukprot:1551894-Pleurochrysis_carterae.AAC.1